jgi:hypothetical protein
VLEVGGVVHTARYRSLMEPPRPFFYRPFTQAFRASMTLHVRVAAGDPYAVLPSIRRALYELDRDLPLSRVQTLERRLKAGGRRSPSFFGGSFKWSSSRSRSPIA